jgi:hypothetical protein
VIYQEWVEAMPNVLWHSSAREKKATLAAITISNMHDNFCTRETESFTLFLANNDRYFATSDSLMDLGNNGAMWCVQA